MFRKLYIAVHEIAFNSTSMMCIKYRYFIVLNCGRILTNYPLVSLGHSSWSKLQLDIEDIILSPQKGIPMNLLPSYLP
jgi:hypothetical protein